MVSLVAWGAVALVAALGVAQALLEWRSLRRLGQLARRPERLKRAVDRLQTPHRPVVRAFVEGARRSGNLDEALTRALVQGARLPFAPPPAVHVAAVVATVVAVLGPVTWALIRSAHEIAALFREMRLEAMRARYITGADRIHPSFEALRAAFDETSLILAALALAWALRWWLTRPEVREARLARALVECAGRLRPGTSAPVGARLAELLAPERGLARPTLAGALWLVAVTAGWLALLGAADLRAGATRPRVFDVWPEGTERRIETQRSVVLPRSDAGSPIVRSERPSLTFTPSAVLFHNATMGALTAGALPDDWAKKAPSLERELADFPRPLEVTVLGHREVPIQTVARVMKALAVRYQVRLYHLIVERGVGLDGGHRLQAALQIEPRISPDAAITVRLDDGGARLLPSRAHVSFTRTDWADKLRDHIRALPDLARAKAPVIGLSVKGASSYDRFIEVLSAMDGACTVRRDCGLPGLGLRFALSP